MGFRDIWNVVSILKFFTSRDIRHGPAQECASRSALDVSESIFGLQEHANGHQRSFWGRNWM